MKEPNPLLIVALILTRFCRENPKMATRILSRSILNTKKCLSSVYSCSYASFSIKSSPSALASLPSFSSLRLSPLVSVAANFHHLSPAAATICGFATRQTTSSHNDSNSNWSNRPPKETILLNDCDFEHWLVVVEKPEAEPLRDEIIDSYIKTLAKVIGRVAMFSLLPDTVKVETCGGRRMSSLVAAYPNSVKKEKLLEPSDLSIAYDTETATKVIKSRNSSKIAESGGFVLWQMNLDMWYVELVLSGSKVHAGFNGFMDTFGFPLDLTQLMAEERGLVVDVEGFNKAMDEARERSRNAQNKTLVSCFCIYPLCISNPIRIIEV